MGSLRFRKSVSICKGVKLNFGKKGVSISAGIPGFRKTYNFNTGKTTTSVGIPGTGIYYVDTSGSKKKKEEKKGGGFFADLLGGSHSSSTPVSNNVFSYKNSSISQECISTKPTTPAFSVYEDNDDIFSTDISPKSVVPTKTCERVEGVVNDTNHSLVITAPKDEEFSLMSKVEFAPVVIADQENKLNQITYDTIKDIFENCDMAINWVEILSNKTPVSDEMFLETWEYLHKKAVAVFNGDIDTFLEIISTVNPYDDLLDYAENFEFGTENPAMMEVEFSVIENSAVKMDKNVFEDYYSAIAIRVARDTFALLPVENTIVHVLYKGAEILNAYFDREDFHKQNLQGKDPSDIIKELCN